MKRTLGSMLATALLGISVALPAVADSSAATAQETPLMVIRFNQAQVDYPTPLYNTINAALKAKPTAVFDIVSVAPRAHETHNQPYYNRIANQNSLKVLSTLHEIGLPSNRLSAADAIDDVSASEVRIYIH